MTDQTRAGQPGATKPEPRYITIRVDWGECSDYDATEKADQLLDLARRFAGAGNVRVLEEGTVPVAREA
jgi:hypothetical protein